MYLILKFWFRFDLKNAISRSRRAWCMCHLFRGLASGGGERCCCLGRQGVGELQNGRQGAGGLQNGRQGAGGLQNGRKGECSK